MAITPQQARMKALQLRSLKPELRNMAIEDLVAQVMATEGMGAPGAGGGALANLFPPKTLTPSSPAPMMAARFQAAKPTAQIVPGADAFRRAQEVRDRKPTVGERDTANANRQALVDEIRGGAGAPAPEVAPAAPVRAASPVASALAAAEAPAKVAPSRYRTRLQQKQAELAQLKASVPASGETPTKLAFDLDILSREVNELSNLVAAEEAAVADPERAAILERQTKRLGREEQLVEQARKRAPFDALIAGGAALVSARPGESFTSALTRGLQAGNQSYSGARDAREASLRGIEEKRDAYALQSIDAVMKARDEAIAIQKAGGDMTEQQTRLANMSREGAAAAAMAPFKQRAAEAETTALETTAKYADQLARIEVRKGEAEITLRNAQAWAERNPGAGSAALADAVKPSATVYSELSDGVNLLTKIAADRFGSTPEARAAALAALPAAKAQLAAYGRLLGIGGAAPAAPAAAAAGGNPPVKGARWSPTQKGWFIPDPNRPGKYLEVVK